MGPVQNVVACCTGGGGKKVEAGPAEIDNKNCTFVPHVQAAMKGSKLTVANTDPILHNTHAYINKTETVFNLALPLQNQKIPKTSKKPGIIDIKCDAGHTWMSAYIVVTENPYFAVTDEKGHFSIKDIPSGTYKVRTWHEELGTQEKEVTITAKGEAKITFDKLSK